MADAWHGANPQNFKMTLLQADLVQELQSWEGWSTFIAGAVEFCREHGCADSFVSEYQRFVNVGDQDGLLDKIRADQMDNYIVGSFALHLMGAPPEFPVVAYAAQNKRLYEGLGGEIANLRTLLLFGYDVDASTSEGGDTALHFMSGLRWGKGVHLRAIQALLEAGANPNAQNNRGDSAFTYLCGSFPWSEDVHLAAVMMLEHGADARLPAKDGLTGLSLLQANQASQDGSLARQALIDRIELQSIGGPTKGKRRIAPTL